MTPQYSTQRRSPTSKIAAEKELQQQVLTDKARAHLALEKEYLDRKYDLLRATLEEEAEDVSVRSRRTLQTKQSRVEKWVQSVSNCASDPGVVKLPYVALSSGANAASAGAPVVDSMPKVAQSSAAKDRSLGATTTTARSNVTTSRDHQSQPGKSALTNQPIEYDLISPTTEQTKNVAIGGFTISPVIPTKASTPQQPTLSESHRLGAIPKPQCQQTLLTFAEWEKVQQVMQQGEDQIGRQGVQTSVHPIVQRNEHQGAQQIGMQGEHPRVQNLHVQQSMHQGVWQEIHQGALQNRQHDEHHSLRAMQEVIQCGVQPILQQNVHQDVQGGQHAQQSRWQGEQHEQRSEQQGVHQSVWQSMQQSAQQVMQRNVRLAVHQEKFSNVEAASNISPIAVSKPTRPPHYVHTPTRTLPFTNKDTPSFNDSPVGGRSECFSGSPTLNPFHNVLSPRQTELYEYVPPVNTTAHYYPQNVQQSFVQPNLNSDTNQRVPNTSNTANYSQLPSIDSIRSMQQPGITYSGPGLPSAVNRSVSSLNQQQLSARHVVPKDLPIFAGDPADWPIFISSYHNSTNMCGYSDSENLMRLQRSLKGTAKEAVYSFLLHPVSVPRIIGTLQTLYGRPEQIVHSLLSKVRGTPSPKPDKLESLVSFGLAVQNFAEYLRAVGLESHLSNPTLMQELIDKLPSNIKLDWALYLRQYPGADLGVFGEYMATIVSAASSVTVTSVGEKKTTVRDERPKFKERSYLNAHSAAQTKEELHLDNPNDTIPKKSNDPKQCAVCEKVGHKVRECFTFKNMSVEDRWKAVQKHRLCRRGLFSHGRWPCKTGTCGIDGCTEFHNRMLHSTNSSSCESTKPKHTVSVHRHAPGATLFRVVPVKLHGKERSIETYAFLDDGSSITMVEQSLADELQIEGPSETLCLQWTGGVTKTIENSQVIEMKVSGFGKQTQYTINGVYTVDSLELPKQTVEYEEMTKEFPHLRGLPVKTFKNATPRILIGLNNVNLMSSYKTREGGPGEPVASKTRLGWIVYGVISGSSTALEHRMMHICTRSPDDDLHDLVNQYFSTESIGVSIAPTVEGDDDRRAREILQKTTIRTSSGRFETGLLWRSDYVEFPNSRPAAEKRLLCLERKLARNPDLHEKVRAQIHEYQSKGYAHKASDAELAQFDPRRTWYLPLGVVLNPKKPEKVRVIWDAAAKVSGVSLNSKLLKGPDLLTSLTAVLFLFRQREFAITADIREMFHQLFIRPQDRQSQLFLWRDDTSRQMETFVMDVATFGSTCSSCSAQHVKNINAAEYENVYPEAARAIKEKHYVDDYLDSFDTEKEAIQLAQQIVEIHQKAGFDLRHWLSNSKEVMRWVGDSKPKPVKNFAVAKEEGSERVLGMVWKPEMDVFSFEIVFRPDVEPLTVGEIVPTKRQMLKVIMSVFDPLGLMSVVTIHGKILIQDVWRSKIGWDDRIPQDIFGRWQQWLKALHDLASVEIPRCYFPGYCPSSYQNLELHVFVDASEQAYAAVAYFRIVDRGEVRCALVGAKAKVAPLQTLSIPRLELQAAVIGVRLANTIAEQHDIPIVRRAFYTDSSVTVSWIQSDQRRYRKPVEVRINEILLESKEEEWKWISTRLNVADEATKWSKKQELHQNSRWFRGPQFLYESEKDWPVQLPPPPNTTEELRPVHSHRHFINEPLIDVFRFSKWQRLLGALTYVHLFIKNCRRKVAGETLSVQDREDIQAAERTAWKLAQYHVFHDEVTILRRNIELPNNQQKQISKSSRIFKRSPCLDEFGVLRVDGRLDEATYVSYDGRYPIILPREHYMTYLLLDWYHRINGHGTGEMIVNEIRQRFDISRLRVELRKAAKKCQWCRVYKAMPDTPRMAALPAARLMPFVRPFTHTGIDYFGPCFINIGRSSVKRWVALFTCLTIRAVHLEVVAALSTDSCKKAIRRFIARRGAPQEIFSDRGTNFVGADKELKREIDKINEGLASTFTDCNTQWHFNPPAAPHMGGCWERMVRSVKAAMQCLEQSRKLDEESFCTLLADAESMVNSRPLTYIPLENSEQESLTPNHFLLLNSKSVTQPMKTHVDDGEALKHSWNLVQHILGQIWRRWIKEYLPTISRRTKWFTDVRPIQVGDLVVVVDEGTRNSWVRGRVLRVFPGKDGRIRKAEVQTATDATLQRPVVRLALLDVVDEGIAEGRPPAIRVGECSYHQQRS